MGEHTISTKIDCDNPKDLATCNIDNPPLQDIVIERTIVHELYDAYLKRNDIALLQLRYAVQFTGIQNVQTICLPVKSAQMIDTIAMEEQIDLQMTISGWGYSETNQEPSDVLMHALTPYLNQTECVKWFEELKSRIKSIDFELTDTHLVNLESLTKSNRHSVIF